MTMQLDACPLIAYLEEHPPEQLDLDFIKHFYEAAQFDNREGGDAEVVYGYGLLLHQLMLDYNLYPEMQKLPAAVREATLAQAFNVFAGTAQQGVAEGMKMAGWCSLMGFGTVEDKQGARVWFDAAAKVLPEDDIQLLMMKRELERRDAPPAGFKPVLN